MPGRSASASLARDPHRHHSDAAVLEESLSWLDMATRNGTWGAERIRGELLKLGVRVAKPTVQRHILAVRPPSDDQSWRTFLKNHVVWAVDFVQSAYHRGRPQPLAHRSRGPCGGGLKASCEEGEHSSNLARAGGQFTARDPWIPQRSCDGRAMKPGQGRLHHDYRRVA